MSFAVDHQPRSDELNALAVMLVQQASALSRVMFGRLAVDLSRTEAGVLARLEAGPQRITRIAELDGLAQPTVTLLVKRLERLGLVRRARDAADGRAVLVSLTSAGGELMDSIRLSASNLLREHLDELPSDDLEPLEAAIRVMSVLVERLQEAEPGRPPGSR